MVSIKDVRNKDKQKELGIISLQCLKQSIDHFINLCKTNKIDPNNVPVLIDKAYEEKYLLNTMSFNFGGYSSVSLQFYPQDEIDFFEGEDKRPEDGGEYWRSRGASDWDCSGFVVSKEAGERLLALVKGVLNKEECKTWLDWRKREPNWIQFKFSAEEFDVEELDKLSKEANGIVTYEILKKCKK